MTDVLSMTPEEYEDAQNAANLHKMQDFIDGCNMSEHGMSVYGFKNANNVLKDRKKFLKSLRNKIQLGLGYEDFLPDPERVKADRAKLRSMMGGV